MLDRHIPSEPRAGDGRGFGEDSAAITVGDVVSEGARSDSDIAIHNDGAAITFTGVIREGSVRDKSVSPRVDRAAGVSLIGSELTTALNRKVLPRIVKNGAAIQSGIASEHTVSFNSARPKGPDSAAIAGLVLSESAVNHSYQVRVDGAATPRFSIAFDAHREIRSAPESKALNGD